MDQDRLDYLFESRCRCSDCTPLSCTETAISDGLDDALIVGLFPEPVLRRVHCSSPWAQPRCWALWVRCFR